MPRTIRTALAVCIALVMVLGVSACAPSTTSSSAPPAPPSTSVTPAKVRIGTLPTEDSLPLWVAQQEGLFKAAGLDVTIVSFQSAAERDAAFTAGAVDGFMGDMVAAASLRAGGIPVKVVTIMLGATPAQGRFGIAVKPKSTVTTLTQLAGVPIGTSSDTIQEYVLDKQMEAAGVPASRIKKQEVDKVPVRFQLLMSGKLEAAALPEPFLSLAEKSGARVVADDTSGANLSQTVLVFGEKYLDDPSGAASVTKLLQVWDQAVASIDKDPNSFRPVLADKAKLPLPLQSNYQVNTYPTAQLPKESDVDPLLAWMRGAGYLKTSVTYADLMWNAPAPAK